MAPSRLLRRSWPRTWFSYCASSCTSGYGEILQPMQQCNPKRLNLPRTAFGIAFDIDGVFIRGSEIIGRGPEALRRLYKDVEKGELLVPYVFLTNGGGTTEADRAKVLTRQLSVPVNPHQVNLGHTPFKSLAMRYRSKRVLAVGKGEPERAMINYGFTTVVKMDDYCKEFQYIDPLESYKPWVKNEPYNKDMIMPANERQIAAVFVCSDPIDWGRDLQVLCDVLRAGGYPGKIDANIPQPPLFFAADDFEYPTRFPVPRLAMGAFRIILQTLYSRSMNRPLSCTSFGKPKPIVYHMAAESLQNVTRMMQGTELPDSPGDHRARDSAERAFDTLYMIGDNPETDIAGAIGAGRPWFSILVRTGNFRGPGNHKQFPADKVVDDVYAAVDFILKKERIH